MNRIQKYILLSFLPIICGALLSLLFIRKSSSPAYDTIALSRIVSEASLHWPDIGAGNYEDFGYEFAAADLQGRILYQTSPKTAASQADALKRQDTILNIYVDGTIAGTVFIASEYEQQLLRRSNSFALYLFLSFALLTILFLIYILYLERSIIRPFKRMQDFARRIACGNLEMPLDMDKNNLFGAFTEAFDLMRTQLQEAREREYLASQSKKELVASLSHDLKTPVTSIKLLSELMLATKREERDMQRLQTIYDKAGQIDRLTADLFHAAVEELEEMKVHPAEMESRRLLTLIQSTDYDNRVQDFYMPECLILADPLRLEQVIGNLVMNSYKYAQTDIHIKCEILDNVLKVIFEDEGPGVLEEELPFLTTRFYRGRNAAGQPQNGAGLGLYISSKIMEKMGGSLACLNCPQGFAVELLFPLA